MAKKPDVCAVTTSGMDGAASAALVLRKNPEAQVVVTSTSRAAATLRDMALCLPRGGAVHVCGVGIDNPDAIRQSLAALREKSMTVYWYCGRGYLDTVRDCLAEAADAVIAPRETNTALVAEHLGISADRRAMMLAALAAEFAAKTEPASDEHAFWHDYVEAAFARFYQFGDEAAYPACIHALAGLAEATDADRKMVARWRELSGKGLPLGNSPAMKRLRALIARLGPVPEPVLVCGPSGAGKEMVARLLHEASPRAGNPFVPVNCAILSTSPELAADRLFGHTKGAYTGADRDTAGAFETADDGTLFLDEVGELPLAVQTQLLRVLEEGTILRTGSMSPRRVNVRIVAATNRDLPAMVAAGHFRLDLYHRLNVLALDVPSLAERREDMKSIANAVIHEIRQKGYDLQLTDADWRAVMACDWPGNIRQFRNLLKRAAYMGMGVAEALAMEEARAQNSQTAPRAGGALQWPVDAEAIQPEDSVRLAYMRHCFALCGGSWTKTAQKLGISVNTLRARLDSIQADAGDTV